MDPRGGVTQIELEFMVHDEDAEPIALPFPLLEKLADYFSDELIIGRGGFVVVYKAVLDNGVLAVKRLFNTHMHEEQFQDEVECLMKVKHKNIVRFLGYCADTQGNISHYKGKMVMADVQQRLLCFEYLPKGSLDGYITDSPGEPNCRTRYDMIKGICEGLHYLHQNNILHLDLTPGNILLDEDMMPKITDFGLSRCFEEDQTGVITKNVAGTRGYLAPECYNKEIILTHKFDLYSLGAIIIEILTGKKGCQVTIENVLQIWNNTMLDALQWDQIRVCLKIGMECTEVDPAKRPASMKHIIDWLAEIDCSTHVLQLRALDSLNGSNGLLLDRRWGHVRVDIGLEGRRLG
ncbi:putative cysteine-rich receptor-like protein kinase 35 [Triticum aestivum]|uniref:putative cysteine-rich receptor-like protein kinase 35 n=1 Tax=Triticum aestivum TaxID=4565 RepID=UPI001D017B5D|nr:putative cysteine-rich receptor-like protein kinase 35 [Triticum aestivum]